MEDVLGKTTDQMTNIEYLVHRVLSRSTTREECDTYLQAILKAWVQSPEKWHPNRVFTKCELRAVKNQCYAKFSESRAKTDTSAGGGSLLTPKEGSCTKDSASSTNNEESDSSLFSSSSDEEEEESPEVLSTPVTITRPLVVVPPAGAVAVKKQPAFVKKTTTTPLIPFLNNKLISNTCGQKIKPEVKNREQHSQLRKLVVEQLIAKFSARITGVETFDIAEFVKEYEELEARKFFYLATKEHESNYRARVFEIKRAIGKNAELCSQIFGKKVSPAKLCEKCSFELGTQSQQQERRMLEEKSMKCSIVTHEAELQVQNLRRNLLLGGIKQKSFDHRNGTEEEEDHVLQVNNITPEPQDDKNLVRDPVAMEVEETTKIEQDVVMGITSCPGSKKRMVVNHPNSSNKLALENNKFKTVRKD